MAKASSQRLEAGGSFSLYHLQPSHLRVADRLVHSTRSRSCHSRVPCAGSQERHRRRTPAAQERSGYDLESIWPQSARRPTHNNQPEKHKNQKKQTQEKTTNTRGGSY